jgi:hypothetical protein
MGNAGFRQRWKMVKVACSIMRKAEENPPSSDMETLQNPPHLTCISQACSFVVEWSWMLSFANVPRTWKREDVIRG